jgi:geranylgeranyl transferase type-2 subunit beta
MASMPDEMQLFVDKHVRWRADLLQRKDELEYWLTEHLRLNGLYWGLTALHLLGQPDALPRQGILDFVFSCLHETGGFGAAPGHDAHMLYTVSGVQILATLDAFGELEDRVKDGRLKIGKCASGSVEPHHDAHRWQLSQTCRTLSQARLQGMSGESKTRASCTVPSTRSR